MASAARTSSLRWTASPPDLPPFSVPEVMRVSGVTDPADVIAGVTAVIGAAFALIEISERAPGTDGHEASSAPGGVGERAVSSDV